MPADFMETDLRRNCNIYMETPLSEKNLIDHHLSSSRRGGEGEDEDGIQYHHHSMNITGNPEYTAYGQPRQYPNHNHHQVGHHRNIPPPTHQIGTQHATSQFHQHSFSPSSQETSFSRGTSIGSFLSERMKSADSLNDSQSNRELNHQALRHYSSSQCDYEVGERSRSRVGSTTTDFMTQTLSTNIVPVTSQPPLTREISTSYYLCRKHERKAFFLMLACLLMTAAFLLFIAIAGISSYDELECYIFASEPSICLCEDNCQREKEDPVCGSNNVTYSNECKLRLESCSQRKDLQILYKGKCDPCRNHDCFYHSYCVISESTNDPHNNNYGLARCVCPEKCPPVSRKEDVICGTNNKTYESECNLLHESCLKQTAISVNYRGPCVFNYSSVSRILQTTGHSSDSTERLQNNIFKLSDKESTIGVEKALADPCLPNVCPPNQVCVFQLNGFDSSSEYRNESLEDKSLNYTCQCKECPLPSGDFDAVCGSDGVTYGSLCILERESCLTGNGLRPLYGKPCQSCDKYKCPFYAECELRSNFTVECICPKVCLREDSPVCGSNDFTYENECELRMASCRLRTSITIGYRGPCDTCRNTKCKYGSICDKGLCVCPTECQSDMFEPICASDGNTYMNKCEMNKWSCLFERDLTAVYYGECREMEVVHNGGTWSTRLDTELTSVGSMSSIQPTSIPTVNTITAMTASKNTTSATLNSGHNKKAKVRHPCDSHRCLYGGVCELDHRRKPYCECQFECGTRHDSSANRKLVFGFTLFENICGSDGNIYENECVLKKASCERQVQILVLDSEHCKKQKKQKQGNHENGHQHRNISEVDRLKSSVTSCDKSQYGCCMDGITDAPGPHYLGCPERCSCNKRGSYGPNCDPQTRQCRCKPGIGGIKCNRCEPGFWGLHRTHQAHAGCTPCNCNKFGSARIDCEQSTGKCVCKPGILGKKCDTCLHQAILGPDGCTHASIAYPINSSCEDLICMFGAVCIEKGTKAQCICDIICSKSFNDSSYSSKYEDMVCGSDGQTYLSECQLRQTSCRYQLQLSIKHSGPC